MNGISDNDAILPQQHHNISDGSVVTVWDEVAAILSAFIGGGRYGLKIRVPHAIGKFFYDLLRIICTQQHIISFLHSSFKIYIPLPLSFSQTTYAHHAK